ncbi:MAG TPA: alpha/beta hydrolase [Candidatus Limnocylindrales bacterium]|nr:alpha/beta hydrolase [Candidatus Limnocylindrales bacterium]
MTDAAPEPRHVVSRDGTPIAVFSTGDGPPLILVHGTTADHTTWRATGPELAHGYRVHAIDRRGRGASGDGEDGDARYSIELEYDDLAAVADAVAGEAEMPVDVVGHSYGGRIGLGAALRTASIGRLVVYEGAPSPADGSGYRPAGVERRIARLIEAGNRDAALQTFFREIVRMPDDELAAYRANPVWPVRVAAVNTVLREIQAEGSPAASLEALGGVTIPVLQVLGSASAEPFGRAVRALDARLPKGQVVEIDGARHAAHHTHVGVFVAAVRAFLEDPDVTD